MWEPPNRRWNVYEELFAIDMRKVFLSPLSRKKKGRKRKSKCDAITKFRSLQNELFSRLFSSSEGVRDWSEKQCTNANFYPKQNTENRGTFECYLPPFSPPVVFMSWFPSRACRYVRYWFSSWSAQEKTKTKTNKKKTSSHKTNTV